MNIPSQDVKDMLVAAGLSLTFSTNLFIGLEPALPANCTTIYDTPGSKPDSTFDKENIYNPSIQIKVRNNSYVAAGIVINQIKDALHNITNEIWNGTTYILIQCSQEPFSLGPDVNGKHQWVVNFDIQRS
jgi:hypothetical protein